MEYFCCVLRRHLIKKFKDVGLFVSSLIVVCSAKGTMQRRHSQSVAGSRRYIVSVVKKVIEIFTVEKFESVVHCV